MRTGPDRRRSGLASFDVRGRSSGWDGNGLIGRLLAVLQVRSGHAHLKWRRLGAGALGN